MNIFNIWVCLTRDDRSGDDHRWNDEIRHFKESLMFIDESTTYNIQVPNWRDIQAK